MRTCSKERTLRFSDGERVRLYESVSGRPLGSVVWDGVSMCLLLCTLIISCQPAVNLKKYRVLMLFMQGLVMCEYFAHLRPLAGSWSSIKVGVSTPVVALSLRMTAVLLWLCSCSLALYVRVSARDLTRRVTARCVHAYVCVMRECVCTGAGARSRDRTGGVVPGQERGLRRPHRYGNDAPSAARERRVATAAARPDGRFAEFARGLTVKSDVGGRGLRIARSGTPQWGDRLPRATAAVGGRGAAVRLRLHSC